MRFPYLKHTAYPLSDPLYEDDVYADVIVDATRRGHGGRFLRVSRNFYLRHRLFLSCLFLSPLRVLRFLQTYLALFRIGFASTTHQSTVYPGVVDLRMNIAMRICNIAFDAFFEDTKQLVATGVTKDVKRKIYAATSDDDRNNIVGFGNDRLSALKTWKKLPRPLAYGLDGGHDIFNLLLRAVAEDKASISRGLLGWKTNSKTLPDLAKLFVDMSRPSKPTPPTAPVLKDGAFLPVLKVAHTSILQIAERDGMDSPDKFLLLAIKTALVVFKVNFFPAHKENSATRGAPHRVPLYNYWGNLGLRPTDNDPPFRLAAVAAALPQIEPETVAYNNAVVTDCKAPWTSANVSFTELRRALNRTNLPSDFEIPAKTRKEYVDNTYSWVVTIYDGANKIHHLALLVAIIASNCLLPRLFPPRDSRGDFVDATTRQRVRDVYAEMPWLERDKGGMKEPKVFIGMITCFIIALYEKDSPLRQQMLKARGGMGNDWTYKNSMLIPFLSAFFHFCIFTYIVLRF